MTTLQSEQPLYPDFYWDRPQNIRQGGRILIVGGHSRNFNLPSTMYQLAQAVGGIGCRVLLPDQLFKIVGPNPDTTYVPSTISGSIASAAQPMLMSAAGDTLAILWAGVSHNAETAGLLEKLAETGELPQIYYDDAIEALSFVPEKLANKHHLLVLTPQQLFRLAGKLGAAINTSQGASSTIKARVALDIHQQFGADLLLVGPELIAVAEGNVCITQTNQWEELSDSAAMLAGIFWAQNQSNTLMALAAASFTAQDSAKIKSDQQLSLPAAIKASLSRH